MNISLSFTLATAFSDKTKATAKGSPVGTRENKSITNNAIFAAGGQSLSDPVITGTTALSRLGSAQLFFNSISQARRNISSLSFEQRSFFSKHDFKRKATTVNKTAQSTQFLSFDIFYPYDCRRDSPHHGAGGFYSDSLALRRWRRLISPSSAETINCPVLSPSSFKFSTASAIACGTRASSFLDFALTAFVAISDFLVIRWLTVYTQENGKTLLTWLTPVTNIVADTFIKVIDEKTKPRKCRYHSQGF